MIRSTICNTVRNEGRKWDTGADPGVSLSYPRGITTKIAVAIDWKWGKNKTPKLYRATTGFLKETMHHK